MTTLFSKPALRTFWKNFPKLIATVFKPNWPLFFASAVLAILLFRNPYNTRTLIPNFEPFPDSFHYVTVSRCFLERGEWKLCRDGIQQELPGTQASVPQAYSLALIPVFLLNFDPRSFYFTNVLLAYLSLFFLSGILRAISRNQFLQALVLLITVTSYHFYWLPTLAMAENLLVPLYLGSMLLLLARKSSAQVLGLGAIAAAVYFTKYAYAPLAVSILFVGFIRVVAAARAQAASASELVKRVTADAFFLLVPVVVSVPFSQNISSSIEFLKTLVTAPLATPETTSSGTAAYFSFSTLSNYLPKYLELLLGKPARFLWDLRPFFPPVVGVLGIAGWIVGLVSSRTRLLATFLLLSTMSQILFMSTFYAFDSRYIYSAFFAILIGLALFVEYVLKHLPKKVLTEKYRYWSIASVLVLAGLLILVPRFTQLRTQAAINLKYAETPWWYLSIVEYNTFFANRREERPQLITLTSPFFIDYFSNNTYTVLPFDEQQDFYNQKTSVWGLPETGSLVEITTEKITAGEAIYLADYGIQANDHFRNRFALYQETFSLEQVHSGCHSLCTIYKVTARQIAPQ